MFEVLKNWIIGIVTLVLFLAVLEILLPSGKIKKVVNLVSGFVLIIAIINPFIALSGKDLNLADFQVSSSNFLDQKDIQQKSKVLEESRIRQIIEVYRMKIIEQAEKAAKGFEGIYEAKADVIINEDATSDDFGIIERLYIGILPEYKKSKNRLIKIEDIKTGEANGLNKSADLVIDEELKEKLVNKISILFNLEKESIVITLLEV
ncbi:MAG TPA: stage III sporulation protein AF [Clostridiaceae bacterium]|nr:stage III sporulation protein AF [Clostridiaceae bacterium]